MMMEPVSTVYTLRCVVRYVVSRLTGQINCRTVCVTVFFVTAPLTIRLVRQIEMTLAIILPRKRGGIYIDTSYLARELSKCIANMVNQSHQPRRRERRRIINFDSEIVYYVQLYTPLLYTKLSQQFEIDRIEDSLRVPDPKHHRIITYQIEHLRGNKMRFVIQFERKLHSTNLLC